jgi:hypothetical protein
MTDNFAMFPFQIPSRASFIVSYVKTLVLLLPKDATPHKLFLPLKIPQKSDTA